MTAFDPQTLAADCAQVRRVLADFCAARSPQDWSRKTGSRAKDWTLRQTLAHLVAGAELIWAATEATLQGQPAVFPGITQRSELPALNAREIAAREHIPPSELAGQLLDVLNQCAERCLSLSARELALPISAPFYNRPLTVAEALGWQLAHPGLVHAAQLANGAGVKPLWIHYSPELLQCQMTRFFNVMSHSYWPERGGELRASVNFRVAGPGGGQWHIILAPDGGSANEGAASRPVLTLWFARMDTLCRLMTLQLQPMGALLRGQMLMWGNVRLGLRLSHLFTPT
jgi:hypothetical protein